MDKVSLNTGSTLLNLAISGSPNGGFLAGKYYFMVGDSNSGKTFLSMTCLAEAARDQNFDDYRFIYDNVEDGMLINLDAMFGESVADRIEPPAKDAADRPCYSDTIESFYFNLDTALAAGKPCIYILDSMDSLDSESSDKKFLQHKKAYDKRRGAGDGGEEEKLAGSYGDGKAKKNSEGMRRAMKGLRSTGSILIVICQTRDNIDAFSWEKKTRSGGRALRFYATVEFWSSIVKVLTKVVNDKPRKIGTRLKLEVKKNRVTGKLYSVETDVFPSYGIDDTGACVDYLVEEGFWQQNGKKAIVTKGLGEDIQGSREKVIRLIERRPDVRVRLRELCGECWQEIEDAISLKRKPRYADIRESGDDAAGSD